MGGVTLKAPINEFSGGFFVTNSTDGELHDFWITEHRSEHRNVLMGQLPCNQPLCFKQWHSSLPVHNACSMRAYGIKPKAQCSRRRRACTCYASMRHAAKFQTDTASIASKTKAPVMKSGSLTGI